jgi:type IV secretion system protein VirB6
MSIDYADSIAQTDQTIQALLSGFIEKTYDFISTTFKTPLLICLLIYLILVGYGVLSGWFQLVWKDFSLLLIKLIGVTALMLNWAIFQAVLVNFFTMGSAELVQTLTSHVFYQSSIPMHGTTESLSQGLMVEVASVGLWVWKMASFSSPLPILLGLVLWICGVGVILYGFVQVMISKIMIALLLASAPFVLGFAFFATTSKVTWSWLELLLSNFMTLLLVSIALNLSFYLLHTMFDELYQTQAKGIQVLQLIPVILMSALSFFMIKRCVLAAQHMGGQLSGNQESRGLNFSVASTAIKAGVRLAK